MVFNSKYLGRSPIFWSIFLRKALANVTSTITADASLLPLCPFCLGVMLLWDFLGWDFFFENLPEDGKESEFFMFSC